MDYSYTPRGTGSTGRPKLRWKRQHILQRNGSKSLNLDIIIIIIIIIKVARSFAKPDTEGSPSVITPSALWDIIIGVTKLSGRS
jgi:hypothetical protein